MNDIANDTGVVSIKRVYTRWYRKQSKQKQYQWQPSFGDTRFYLLFPIFTKNNSLKTHYDYNLNNIMIAKVLFWDMLFEPYQNCNKITSG